MPEHPPEETFVVAVDLGTGGPKAIVLDGRGNIRADASQTVELQLLPDGGAEQDPQEWWRAVVATVRTALAGAAVSPQRVVGLGCTAQWAGTVAVDQAGHAVGNAVIWLDARGSPYVRRVAGGPVAIMGYDVRKMTRWVRLTGGAPTLSGRDPVGHILYLRHDRPDVYQSASVFLEPVDYLNLRLTGRVCSSWDAIGLHWVTDNRNINAIRYDRDLIKMADLDAAKLPELVPTGTVIGGLTAQAARELGLVEGTPVVTGTGDLHSAAVGSGAVGDLEAHLYIGTSSWISCHVPWKKTDALHNVASIPSAISGRYVVADEHETAGACLNFLRDNLLFPSDGLGTPAPADFFDRCNEIAATVAPGAGGVLFTPWLNGERSPVDDHTIRSGFHNMSLSTTRSDLVRAVFEGVALNNWWLLGTVERFVKKRLDHLAFIGGGANSPLWAQMHADVLDRTVRTIKEPRLANARGAGLLALLALGQIRLTEVPSMVEAAAEYRPEPGNTRIYRRMGKEFVELYKRNKAIHRRLNR